jgi:hypothetical protein
MAGGLFGRPFELNVKCIIFSMIIMTLFLYNPNIKSNLVLGIVLFTIFVISYVSMAWYDYYYGCDILPFKKGAKSLTGLAKPPIHSNKQIRTQSEDCGKGHLMIYLSHIIFIVPLLVYIGLQKNKVNILVYPILIVLAIFTLFYHGLAVMYGSHNM